MNNLRSVLQTNLSARYLPINQIPDCVCVASSRQFIHFDEVKENYCTALGISNRLKSADCLHIDEEKRLICFIEVKNATAHIARNWSTVKEGEQETCIIAFDSWLIQMRADLRAKISDSIYIITSSLAQYQTNTADIKAILDRDDVKIKYFVIYCMSNSDLLTYSLSSLQSIKKNAICYGVLAGKQSSAFVFTADELETYIAAFL